MYENPTQNYDPEILKFFRFSGFNVTKRRHNIMIQKFTKNISYMLH